MKFPLPLPSLTLVTLLLIASACQRGEITAYRVPKETEQAPVASAAPEGTHREVDWKVPSGWQERAASGMRVGSFLAKGSNGQEVDISVVPLAGEAGGELPNVNRWRAQLNLAAIDRTGLSKVAKSVRIGAHDARLVEFSNGEGKRLLAAVVRRGETSWFFKATGDDGAVKDIRPAFMSFVKSAHFHQHEHRHE